MQYIYKKEPHRNAALRLKILSKIKDVTASLLMYIGAVIGVGIALTLGVVYLAFRRSNAEYSYLLLIHENQLKIMATQAELAQQLNQVATQVSKIGEESTKTLQKVEELEEALNNQDNVSPELQTAFDNLKAQVQTVDDLVVDTTVPTDPTEPQV